MARFTTGQRTVSAAAQQISSVLAEYSAFIVKAKAANAGSVALGDSTVTTSTGFLLEPGETITYGGQLESGEPIFDLRLQDLYVIGTSGDTVSWLAHKL